MQKHMGPLDLKDMPIVGYPCQRSMKDRLHN